MKLLPQIVDRHAELTAIRRDIHAHPEIGFEEVRTAALVAERLRSCGVDEVATGVGRTGVVGVIRGSAAGPTVGLRADMDALPMSEETNLPYASRNDGVFHGCGHDGHTTMLLGAAKHLATTRDFRGNVVLIFQPAEEGLGGARAMIEDRLFERFPATRSTRSTTGRTPSSAGSARRPAPPWLPPTISTSRSEAAAPTAPCRSSPWTPSWSPSRLRRRSRPSSAATCRRLRRQSSPSRRSMPGRPTTSFPRPPCCAARSAPSARRRWRW